MWCKWQCHSDSVRTRLNVTRVTVSLCDTIDSVTVTRVTVSQWQCWNKTECDTSDSVAMWHEWQCRYVTRLTVSLWHEWQCRCDTIDSVTVTWVTLSQWQCRNNINWTHWVDSQALQVWLSAFKQLLNHLEKTFNKQIDRLGMTRHQQDVERFHHYNYTPTSTHQQLLSSFASHKKLSLMQRYTEAGKETVNNTTAHAVLCVLTVWSMTLRIIRQYNTSHSITIDIWVSNWDATQTNISGLIYRGSDDVKDIFQHDQVCWDSSSQRTSACPCWLSQGPSVIQHTRYPSVYWTTSRVLFTRPVYGSDGRSYKMLVMFFFFFFARRSPSSLDRSPWNFATWSESGLIL